MSGSSRHIGRNSLCKAPGGGLCLAWWRNSEEAHVAGAEGVRGKEVGGEGREGTRVVM